MECRFHRKSWRRKAAGPMLSVQWFRLLFFPIANFVFFSSLIFACFLHSVDGALPIFSEFRFLIEPSSIIAIADQPAILDCTVHYSGSDKPEISWIRYGDNRQLDDNSRRYMLSNGSLYFKSILNTRAGESDEGDYQCRATISSLGIIVSRRANLQIAHLPKHFEEEPEDLYLAPGDTAALECLIHGDPSPRVTWYKGPMRLIPTDNMKVYPTGLLEIGHITVQDYGAYACEAEIPDKSRTSRMAMLSQASPEDPKLQGDPKFIITPRNERVVKDETVFLHCVAFGRDREGRPPIISWLKDGSTVVMGNNNTRVQVIGAGTLMIRHVSESDAGVYTCRAVNQEDSVDADAALTVLVPPVFTEKPSNKFAHTQSDIVLECEAYGFPRPVITWMKNGETLKTSEYFRILPKGSLKILGLVSSDNGMYQCVAENELGDVQSSAQLVVLSEGALYSEAHSKAPTPIKLKAVLISKRFITLSWDLPDTPGAADVTSYSVFWRESGSERERVSNTTLKEFSIQGLKPRTEYEVRVRAYNNQGPSLREAKITVNTGEEVLVPSPPINLKATTISSMEIKVTWNPPVDPKGIVESYVLIYYKVGSKRENDIPVKDRSYTLKKLQQFSEYSFRVVAVNENGPGTSTSEVVARTFSDTPSSTPQNFTLEVSSSTSLIVRWQPPPEDAQNGVITGYKIRLRKKGVRQGETVVTDGNRNTYALTELRKGTEYQVRISAMTVNGSGPATPWASATTYRDDLDESTVPPKPAHLFARPKANSIIVSWAPPPPHSKILVRGYVLGYGRGIADVFKHTLDANTHDYIIENLQPASQYVITIRAFNSLGQGPSRYETVITSEEMEEEPVTPMMPPVGLKGHVLSSTSIVLTWADNSLSRNQKIMDNRYYTIRYRPLNSRGSKFRYINATDLNYHIESLRPSTEYEFMVKVIKGRRESDFSMTISKKTEEAAPSTEPRDLTPTAVEGNPLAVRLNWQPPARPNGQITSYFILYSNDLHADSVMWPTEAVVGDSLSTVIEKLTPDTTYHFKVQARNKKGYSPESEAVTFVTPPVGKTHATNTASGNKDEVEQTDAAGGEKDKGLTTNVIIIICACVAGFVFCTVVIIIIICLCKCRGNRAADQNKAQTKLNKIPPPNVKPPDLWIHQSSHLELQKMERSQRSESSASVATSTLRRGSRGSADQTDDQGSTLDRRRNSFVGDGGYPSSGEERYQPIQPRNLIRPKPITLPVDAQSSFREREATKLLSLFRNGYNVKYMSMVPGANRPSRTIATVTAAPNGHILQYGDSPGGPLPMRPIYPRTQYNTQYTSAARVNAGDLPHTCPPTSKAAPSKVLTAVDEDDRDGNSDVPGMDESYNSRIGYVKPQQNISPYKKPTAPVMSPPTKGSRTPISFNKSPEMKNKKEEADLSKSLSTEELTAEMANLEGLMKDLNAITQQEFEC